MERSSRIKRHFDGITARIEISKVKASDAGEYTCVATNVLGSMRSSCQVNNNYMKYKLTICRQFIFFKIYYVLFIFLRFKIDNYSQVTILELHDSSIADKNPPHFLQSLPKESIVMENHCHEFQTGITGKLLIYFLNLYLAKF